MQRIKWATDCTEIDAIPGFPHLRRISEEVVTDSSYRWAGATRDGPDHCLIKLTLSGHGWFSYVDQTYRVDPGHAFICRVCDPDVVYWRDAADSEPWEFIFFAFDGSQTESMIESWITHRGPIARLSPDHPVIHRSRSWQEKDGITVDAGFGLGFLGDLFRAMAASEPQSDPGAQRARQALALMREHLADNWSVDDFAAAVGVTREQLTRDCQRYTGEAPYRAYRRLRVDAAARALVDGSQSVGDIAATYGWANTAHFSRVFRHVTGTTPRQCRATRVLPLISPAS